MVLEAKHPEKYMNALKSYVLVMQKDVFCRRCYLGQSRHVQPLHRGDGFSALKTYDLEVWKVPNLKILSREIFFRVLNGALASTSNAG